MERELRELFEYERRKVRSMPQGHEERFEKRMHNVRPKVHRIRIKQFGIAASFLLFIGLAYWRYTAVVQSADKVMETQIAPHSSSLTLGRLSPDLEKVESYYDGAIKLELARLSITSETKFLAADFLKRLEELDQEYRNLAMELNEIGPNEDTITAMLRNLQLRLQVLQDLKSKLKIFKTAKNERSNKNA
jgi:hypothetical protein